MNPDMWLFATNNPYIFFAGFVLVVALIGATVHGTLKNRNTLTLKYGKGMMRLRPTKAESPKQKKKRKKRKNTAPAPGKSEAAPGS